jgi:hypothetical protein
MTRPAARTQTNQMSSSGLYLQVLYARLALRLGFDGAPHVLQGRQAGRQAGRPAGRQAGKPAVRQATLKGSAGRQTDPPKTQIFSVRYVLLPIFNQTKYCGNEWTGDTLFISRARRQGRRQDGETVRR